MPSSTPPNISDFIEVLLAWRTDRIGHTQTLNFGNGGPRFRMHVKLREGYVSFGIRQRKAGTKQLIGRMFKGKVDNSLDDRAFEVEVRKGLNWLASCADIDDKDPERDDKKSFAHMATLPNLIEQGYWTKPRLDGRRRERVSARRMVVTG